MSSSSFVSASSSANDASGGKHSPLASSGKEPSLFSARNAPFSPTVRPSLGATNDRVSSRLKRRRRAWRVAHVESTTNNKVLEQKALEDPANRKWSNCAESVNAVGISLPGAILNKTLKAARTVTGKMVSATKHAGRSGRGWTNVEAERLDRLWALRLRSAMIAEIDIWRAANLIIKQFGDSADMEAARRILEMERMGDAEGKATWTHIRIVICQLLNTERTTQ
jgi:hypothetical protein